MGLLDKARNTQSLSPYPESVKIPDINQNKEDSKIFERIRNLNNSIDYASNFFRLFCESLRIQKAVLFYKSEEQNSFLNLCSSGYDVTTNNRLRLDEAFFQDSLIHDSISKKLPFFIEDPSPLLKDYFSTREYGMIEEMYFLPVFHKEELITIILISEWKELVPDRWISLFKRVAETVCTPLLNSRKVLLNTDVKYDETVTIDQKSAITEVVEAQKDSGLYFICLNLSHLMEVLITDGSGFTAVNIKKEILSVFKTMSGGEVDLFELPNNRILLIQKKDRIINIDLYLYQLSASLPLLYTNLIDSPDLEPHVISYPDTNTLEEILKEIL